MICQVVKVIGDMKGGEAFRDSAVQEAVWGVVKEAWPGQDALTGYIVVVDVFVCGVLVGDVIVLVLNRMLGPIQREDLTRGMNTTEY